MAYKYSFDEAVVGDCVWDLDDYMIIQECLTLLRSEIKIWNKRAAEAVPGRIAYAQEDKDLRGMIKEGQNKLASSKSLSFAVSQISVGSLRYIKAGLLLGIRRKEEELLDKVKEGWPGGARSVLVAKIDELGKLAKQINYEPADILWELIPKQHEGKKREGRFGEGPQEAMRSETLGSGANDTQEMKEAELKVEAQGKVKATDVLTRGDKGEEGSEIRSAFREFLIDKKGVPEEALRRDIEITIGTAHVDMLKVSGKGDSTVAVIDFSPVENNRGISNSNKRVRKYLIDSKLENCSAYIVCQAKYEKEYPFDIYQVSDTDKPEAISYGDFPDYKKMLEVGMAGKEVSSESSGDDDSLVSFRSKLTGLGIGLFDKLITLIESDPAFRIEPATANYINVKIRKPARVALQIHRTGDNASELRIAVAGWDEKDPGIENKWSIVRRDIVRLSGLNDSTPENYWLRGKIASGSKANLPPYEAKVYIIDPSMSDEAWEELESLLRFAKESTIKGGGAPYTISINKDEDAWIDIERLVAYLNDTCAYVNFVKGKSLPISEEYISCPQTHMNVGEAFIYGGDSYKYMVFTERQYDNNKFWDPHENVIIATSYDWKRLTELPENNGAVYFVATVIASEVDRTLQHRTNTGCIYDYLKKKRGIDKCMKEGKICPACLAHIESNLPDEKRPLFDDLIAILDSLSQASVKALDVLSSPKTEQNKGSRKIGGLVSVKADKISGKEDMLKRGYLVNALSGVFSSLENDTEGFAVALLGDWGIGKSTVIKLLKEKLNDKFPDDFVFAEFNAWEYEHTENIFAGLAQETVKGLTTFNGNRFIQWCKQVGLRFSFMCKVHTWEIVRFSLFLIVVAAGSLLWQYTNLSKYLTISILSLGALPFLCELYKMYERARKNSLAEKMLKYMRLPAYNQHLGLVPVLKKDIQTLCRLRLGNTKEKKTKKKVSDSTKSSNMKKLVLFVDDLDRCQSKCISKTLDAIRLVMSIPNVIVMIAIDHRIAFKAVEKHYEPLADDNNSRTSADIARDYLGKIIQIPVRLESAKGDSLEEYIKNKLFKDVEYDHEKTINSAKVDESDSSTDNERKEEPVDTSSEEFIDSTKDINQNPVINIDDDSDNNIVPIQPPEKVKIDMAILMRETPEECDHFFSLAKKFNFGNPRQLLRLKNTYRLLKALVYENGGNSNDFSKLMTMLFWQEFLYNWPMEIRGRCMAALNDKMQTDKIIPEARRVFYEVRTDINKLFIDEPEKYEELAKFVRIVVLPHNEEGVLDTKADIDAWIKKMDKEAGSAKQ